MNLISFQSTISEVRFLFISLFGKNGAEKLKISDLK